MVLDCISTRIRFKVSSDNWINQPVKEVCLMMVWIRCPNGPREQANNTVALDEKKRAKLINQIREEKTWSGSQQLDAYDGKA
ncbi:hypothetical protein F511_28850 [Dorcoceras hygrometricum]|uniref:Uncharacterized protein n=1 Tax=Dorcoceras hygrometricum TaxID=472368 RepID=A0A2Z7CEI3_9LAMI|nr:hypothetical protein F511_28850 [Dorcoceras hygrometricum]